MEVRAGGDFGTFVAKADTDQNGDEQARRARRVECSFLAARSRRARKVIVLNSVVFEYHGAADVPSEAIVVCKTLCFTGLGWEIQLGIGSAPALRSSRRSCFGRVRRLASRTLWL